MDPQTGALVGGVKNTYDPNMGKEMVACAKKDGGVNHSFNDENTISARQADPHSHALVLDPFVGQVAYVPDLGKDLVREFYYDVTEGKIAIELNVMPSGLSTGKPDGPRYFEFHPQHNIAYVVNELSSTVSYNRRFEQAFRFVHSFLALTEAHFIIYLLMPYPI